MADLLNRGPIKSAWTKGGGRSPLALALLAAVMAMFTGLAIWDTATARARFDGLLVQASPLNAERAIASACGDRPTPACAASVSMDEVTDRRSALDLLAQQEMARWAFLMVLIALLQAGVGAVGLYLLIGTFRQGEENARLLRESQYADHRTWMEVALPQVGIEVTADGAQVQMEVVATNAGKQPALRVNLFARAISFATYMPDDDAITAIIEAERAMLPNPVVPGGAVLPGRNARMTISAAATPDPGAAAKQAFARALYPEIEERTPAYMIVYGVFYTSIVGGGQRNWTVEAAMVHAADGTGIAFTEGTYTSERIKGFPIDSYTAIA